MVFLFSILVVFLALQQARTYYEAAKWQLIEGQTVDAARRIHEALRRISSAAAELARSCGDGQTTLPGAAPVLEVTPAHKRIPTGAAAMSLPTVRDASPAEQPRSSLASQA